jgi:hypothetical protein
MPSNRAIPFTTGTVISFLIAKEKLVSPNVELDKQTVPFLSVSVSGIVLKVLVSTKKDIFAFAEVLDRGTYPMLRARETTFSLSVALSIKTSLLTMLALYEEIYVLYANKSMIVERLDPSKS